MVSAIGHDGPLYGTSMLRWKKKLLFNEFIPWLRKIEGLRGNSKLEGQNQEWALDNNCCLNHPLAIFTIIY